MNQVTGNKEKFGGRNVWRKNLYLKEFLRAVGGVDMGFVGNKFTWENKQEGQMLIKERLDLAVASRDWVERFQQAIMRHLNMEASYHYAILFQMDKFQNF